MKTSGIYLIECAGNGGIYVGASVNIESRKRVHFHHLRAGAHANAFMQSAFDKYGESSFRHSIAIACKREELMREEYALMDKLILSDALVFNIITSDDDLKIKAMAVSSWSDEGVRLRGAAIKEAWSKPEVRAKIIAAMSRSAGTQRNVERVSRQMRERWANPEFKAGMKAKLAENAASDPQFKQKVSEASKKNWARADYREDISRKRLEMWSDPEFRAKRQAQMKVTMNTPERKAAVSAKTKAYWASPAGIARKQAMKKV